MITRGLTGFNGFNGISRFDISKTSVHLTDVEVGTATSRG